MLSSNQTSTPSDTVSHPGPHNPTPHPGYQPSYSSQRKGKITSIYTSLDSMQNTITDGRHAHTILSQHLLSPTEALLIGRAVRAGTQRMHSCSYTYNQPSYRQHRDHVALRNLHTDMHTRHRQSNAVLSNAITRGQLFGA